jgi:type IV pilus assembly protein PilN
MIRINLLPLRAERKKEDARRLISVYVLSVSLVLIGMVAWYLSGRQQVSRLEDELAKNKSEIAHYTELAKQIDQYKAQKAALDAKLGVITDLERSKTGPVHLLDELATRLPVQRLWLTSLEQRGSGMTLKGQALDNESIANFMRQLEASDYISNVDLQGVEQKENGGSKLMEFSLACTVSMTGATPPAPAPKPGLRMAQK